MSLAYQKLNGEGTTAGAQLEELREINEKLQELIDKPDMHQLLIEARSLFPLAPLSPFYETHKIPRNGSVALSKRVYGRAVISHHNHSHGNANHERAMSMVEVFDQLDIKGCTYLQGFHDNFTFASNNPHYLGAMDAFRLRIDANIHSDAEAYVTVFGYVIDDAQPVPPPPLVPFSLSFSDGFEIDGAQPGSVARVRLYFNNVLVSDQVSPFVDFNTLVGNDTLVKVNVVCDDPQYNLDSPSLGIDWDVNSGQDRIMAVNLTNGLSLVVRRVKFIVVAGNGTVGTGLSQLSSPDYIAIYDGDYYVVDEGNHRVVRWSPDATEGVLVAGTGVSGAGLDQLSAPKGIYIDSLGGMYISDSGNDRVVKWAAGALIGVVVAGGNGVGAALNQVNDPSGVYVLNDDVFVVDTGNFRVVKWAEGAIEGVVVAAGNGNGSALNQLGTNAKGIYIAPDETVYVCDPFNNRVAKWPVAAVEGVVSVADKVNDMVLGADGYFYGTDHAVRAVLRWLDGQASIPVVDVDEVVVGIALDDEGNPVLPATLDAVVRLHYLIR